MSTLRTDNLTSSNGVGGSIPMSFAVQGTAKAWFNLNGTGTIAARDDFNVASYTDNGVGDYTATFSTARPNANYAQAGIMGPTIGSTAEGIRPVSQTTTAVRQTVNTNTTPADFSVVMCSVHGDPH
jgi:hypothetical protein